MYIFRRPDYRSQTTQFLEQLHKSDPSLHQRQQASRAQTWADNTAPAQHHTAPEAQAADVVKQSGYVYLTQPVTQAQTTTS